MSTASQADPNRHLVRQGLARPLTLAEQALAAKLEAIFATGEHGFDAVASSLQQQGVARPSGDEGLWTPAILEYELHLINQDLDRAYQAGGSVDD